MFRSLERLPSTLLTFPLHFLSCLYRSLCQFRLLRCTRRRREEAWNRDSEVTSRVPLLLMRFQVTQSQKNIPEWHPGLEIFWTSSGATDLFCSRDVRLPFAPYAQAANAYESSEETCLVTCLRDQVCTFLRGHTIWEGVTIMTPSSLFIRTIPCPLFITGARLLGELRKSQGSFLLINIPSVRVKNRERREGQLSEKKHKTRAGKQ